jgi:glycerol-3-phosphate cytidylyltransferase-like family protein
MLSEQIRARKSRSVSKKRQEVSTNTERERQEVAEEIKYVGRLLVRREIEHEAATETYNTYTLPFLID